MRKNLMITLWLAAPIAVFAGLIVWIFVAASKPRLMDEAPVGAGAGDTGGANALGEWLAGHDPDAIERANIARRERRPIDPLAWPGGVRVVVRAPESAPITVGWIDPSSGLLRSVALLRREGVWESTLRNARPPAGTAVYRSMGGMSRVMRDGVEAVVDDAGVPIEPITIEPITPGETLVSEPIEVELSAP